MALGIIVVIQGDELDYDLPIEEENNIAQPNETRPEDYEGKNLITTDAGFTQVIFCRYI